MNAKLVRVVMAGAVISMIAGAVLAQQKKEEKASPPAPPAPLSGPSVTDRAVPGAAPTFTEPEQGKLRQREVPIRAFQEALMSAVGPEAPEELRVSEEIGGQIRKLLADFRRQMEAFAKENREELQKARRQRQEEMDSGTGNDASRKQREEMAEPGRALHEGAPKPSDTYAKVWTLLNAKQKEAVEAKIEEFRHQQDVREGEAYVKRRLAKNEPVPGQDPALAKERKKDAAPEAKPEGKPEAQPKTDPRPRAGVAPGRMAPEVRDRIMRVFERMTPEERERILARIEGMLAERRGQGDRRAPAEDAKPPAMDEVEVPKPERP